MCNRIILQLFQCFISHVATSETEIKLFQPLKKSSEVISKLFQQHWTHWKRFM